MDLNDGRNNDHIEQEHAYLLRGDGAGGFAGLNALYTLWGRNTLRSRQTVIARSILFLVLVALAAWWLGSQ